MKISNSASLFNVQKMYSKNQTFPSFKGIENKNSNDKYTKQAPEEEKKEEFLANYQPETYSGKILKWMFCAVDKYIVPLDGRDKITKVKKSPEIVVPQEYIDLFEEIKDFDGNMFSVKAFLALSKILGVDDISMIEYLPAPTGTPTYDLNIAINTSSRFRDCYEFLNKDDSRKWGELGFLAGGLKQVQQYCDILRLGDEAIEAYKEKYKKAFRLEYVEFLGMISGDEAEREVEKYNLDKVKIFPPYVHNSEEEKHAMKLLESFKQIPPTKIASTLTDNEELNEEISKKIKIKEKERKEKLKNEQLSKKIWSSFENYPFEVRFLPKIQSLKNNLAIEEKKNYEKEIFEYIKKWQEDKENPDEKILNTVNKCLELIENGYQKYILAYSDYLYDKKNESPNFPSLQKDFDRLEAFWYGL